MQNKFWDNIVSSKDGTEDAETPQNGVETDDGLSPSQWDDITSRIEASDDLPNVPTPSDIGGSEALEQATMSWQSKGVVTFPSAGFSANMNPAQGIAGSPSNKIYGWQYGSTNRFVYTIPSTFTNNAATATRESDTTWDDGIWGHSSTVDGNNLFAFSVSGSSYSIHVRRISNGSERWSNNGICVTPLPSQVAVLTSSTATSATMYAVDNESSPTKLLAYTLSITNESLTYNSADDITLASGAGTVSTNNTFLLTDGTYIWIAGINTGNARRVQGFAYNICDGCRVSARDFDYTDTVTLGKPVMNTSGDIFVFRSPATDVSEVTNTARVLEYTAPPAAPTWTTIPAQTAYKDEAFSLDVSSYVSGRPAPTISVSGNPSWLTLSGTTLSGTPTCTAAATTVTLTATNSAGTANRTFRLTVDERNWRSKGIVTFPSGSTDFKPHLLVLNGLSGSPANKIYSVESFGASSRNPFVFTVGAFSNNAATATRDSVAAWPNTIAASAGSVDGTHYYLPYQGSPQLEINSYLISTGASVRGADYPTPYPSTATVYVGNNIVYALDSTTSPTRLKYYTFPQSGDLIACSSNDIVLASGAGTTALTNPRLITDGTYIWLIGLSSANTITGWCYRMSTRARESSRDISYTDTSNLSWITMNSAGEVYAFRRANFADETANTARVLEYVTTTPTTVAPCWSTIPNLTTVAGSLFELDLSTYVSGTPTPTIAVKTMTTLPSWLTLSGTTISGTPTEAACPVRVDFTATNIAGSTDVDFTIEVIASTTAFELHGVRIRPLIDKVTCRTEATPVLLATFDDDVELDGGAGLETNAAAWLEQQGVILPDSQVTVRAREARTIEALNAPCSTRRFAYGATFTLRIAIRPSVSTAPTTSAFSVTGGTLTSITTVAVGRLYDLLVTFPSTGTGTTTLSALASAFDGVTSNIQLMECLYGQANLRTANFPTGVRPESTSVTFDIIAEPSLTATPQASAIRVSAGRVTRLCEISAGRLYRCTIALPSGTGTVTVTALHGGFTNVSANVVLGTISYRAV